MTEKLGYIEAVFDVGDDLLWCLSSGLKKIIPRTDAGSARESARSVGGGSQAQLFRRVGIQQIRLQNSILNHDGAPRGDAFAIERRGAKAAGHGSVIDYVDICSGNLLF